jgi:hypothetical protein
MPHKDPEVRKAYHRAWHRAHRDEALDRMKRDYRRDKSKRRDYMREYYRQHAGLQSKYARKRRASYPWRHLIKGAKDRAIKKSVPFALTEQWGATTWTGVCAVTRIPFDLGKETNGPGPRSPTIDRIEARKGYVPGNCRFILACVNGLKHGGSDAEMYETAIAIVKSLPYTV